jgi:RNase adaptor protein for sRNA GlmZ degradation
LPFDPEWRRRVLTTRQELKRFGRKTLGDSKSVENPQARGRALLRVYNLVRRHHSLGTTPAVAAGLEEEAWSLEKVVEMTEAYWRRKGC